MAAAVVLCCHALPIQVRDEEERDDSPDHRSEYEDDIVKAAFRLLDEDPRPGS